MKFDSILVVTYGRSGSTLLQGVLNNIDGCLIRGENENFCFALYQAYQSLKNTTRFGEAAMEVTHPWYGATFISEEIFLNQASQMAKDLILAEKKDDPTIKCYGFKEIRYFKTEVSNNFADYLDFLSKIFPNVCFIFNTRNLDDVVKSGWWAKYKPGKAKQQLEDLENIFADYCNNHNNTFQITYEDIVSKSKKFEAMFDFLGVEYDKENIDKILNVDYGYD